MAGDARAAATGTAGAHAPARPARPRVGHVGADAATVHRFGSTERLLHAAHGSAFMVMLATGLVLYLPFLAQTVSARPLMKAVHLVAAVAWLGALALTALLGDRRALRQTRRDLERFDADDRLWLARRLPSRKAPGMRLPVSAVGSIPQGRFNAGQKVHSVVQAALSVLFVVSGTLLWLGERNTDLRLPGTLALHDMAMLVGSVLVAGHVYMALGPEHRPSLEGITKGTVPAGYAATHHPKWTPSPTDPGPSSPSGLGRRALAVIVVVIALGAAVLLVRDIYGGDDGPRQPTVPVTHLTTPGPV